jgi:hypothetical protein
MNLRENLFDDCHLKSCGRTKVTTLIVAFSLVIALSQPMEPNIPLQEINSSFEIYLRIQHRNLCSVSQRHLILIICLPTPMHWHSILQNSQSFSLSSSDTLCLLSVPYFEQVKLSSFFARSRAAYVHTN